MPHMLVDIGDLSDDGDELSFFIEVLALDEAPEEFLPVRAQDANSNLFGRSLPIQDAAYDFNVAGVNIPQIQMMQKSALAQVMDAKEPGGVGRKVDGIPSGIVVEEHGIREVLEQQIALFVRRRPALKRSNQPEQDGKRDEDDS